MRIDWGDGRMGIAMVAERLTPSCHQANSTACTSTIHRPVHYHPSIHHSFIRTQAAAATAVPLSGAVTGPYTPGRVVEGQYLQVRAIDCRVRVDAWIG